mgnify:CR=1 FL=1|jgi:ribosomal protein L29
MQKNQLKELRGLDIQALNVQLAEFLRKLAVLRMQRVVQSDKVKSHNFKILRSSVARIKTIMREKKNDHK